MPRSSQGRGHPASEPQGGPLTCSLSSCSCVAGVSGVEAEVEVEGGVEAEASISFTPRADTATRTQCARASPCPSLAGSQGAGTRLTSLPGAPASERDGLARPVKSALCLRLWAESGSWVKAFPSLLLVMGRGEPPGRTLLSLFHEGTQASPWRRETRPVRPSVRPPALLRPRLWAGGGGACGERGVLAHHPHAG